MALLGKRTTDEGFVDLEQQFILRMPAEQGKALARDVELGTALKDNLFIDIQPDQRWGNVTYGGQVFAAKMVDLPCIIESLKTTDRKTFYKTADVCQILICSQDMEPSDDDAETPKKKKDKEKKHKHIHGICPPLKNVRKRRFRKTLEKKQIDIADIEKEVKRLFRMDNEAINVKWEVTTNDKAVGGESGSVRLDGSSSAIKTTAKEASGSGGGNARVDLAEQDIFGELSSTDEDDDDEDKDVNILDSDEDSDGGGSHGAGATVSSLRDGEQGDDDDGEDELDASAGVDVRAENVLAELQELRAKIRMQRSEVAAIENPELRQRFESVLDELLIEEVEKQQEYRDLLGSGAPR